MKIKIEVNYNKYLIYNEIINTYWISKMNVLTQYNTIKNSKNNPIISKRYNGILNKYLEQTCKHDIIL